MGLPLDPAYGPFNRLMNAIGFHNFNWLSTNLMLPSIIIIAIWEWTGYNCIILYTALKSVPRDVVEAAILDDTPLWRIIVRIKLPRCGPPVIMLVFINTIGAMQLFVEPTILNNYQAGVVTNTWTPVIDIYTTSISNGEYQLGAAMAVVLAGHHRHLGDLAGVPPTAQEAHEDDWARRRERQGEGPHAAQSAGEAAATGAASRSGSRSTTPRFRWSSTGLSARVLSRR